MTTVPADVADLVVVRAASFLPQLLQGRWFADLDAAFQTALVAAARVRSVAHNERLFARGDAYDGLFVVVDGAVRVTSVTESGREVLLTRVEAPTWFGDIAVFDRQPRTHDCIADGVAIVLHLRVADLDAILSDDPRRWRDLGLLVASKLRLTFSILEDVAVLPLAARLAHRLLVLADGHGELIDAKKRVLVLTQEQLASMLSSSRQSVNQVLKDFEARGFVKVTYGQIELVDVEALTALRQM